MNIKAWLVCVAMAAAIGGSAMAAASPGQPEDSITLADGRVVHGQIVMESKDTLVLQMGASHRSFARNFISKVAYGDGGDQAVEVEHPQAGAPVPNASAPPAAGQEDLASGLSSQYQVPLNEVLWVRAQGVSDADLPMVFMVAASAQVTPAKVVALLLAGQSWDEIEGHFSMQPSGVYYEDEPWGVDPCYEPALVLGPGWDGYWGDGYRGGGYWGGNGWHGGGHWNGGRGAGQWNGGTGHWNGGSRAGRIGSFGSSNPGRGGSHWSMGGPARSSGGWSGGAGRSAGGGGGSRSGSSHGR